MGPLRTDLLCTATDAGRPMFRIRILNVSMKTEFTILHVHFRNECQIGK